MPTPEGNKKRNKHVHNLIILCQWNAVGKRYTRAELCTSNTLVIAKNQIGDHKYFPTVINLLLFVCAKAKLNLNILKSIRIFAMGINCLFFLFCVRNLRISYYSFLRQILSIVTHRSAWYIFNIHFFRDISKFLKY